MLSLIKMKKRTFHITEENFPIFTKKLDGIMQLNSAYQFPLFLPYHIPIEEKSYLSLKIEKTTFIAWFDTIYFEDSCEEDISELTSTNPNTKHKKTYLEIILLSEDEVELEPNLSVFNAGLTEVLKWLNHLILNLKIKTRNLKIERLTRKHLPTGMLCEYFNPFEWSKRIKFSTITNLNEKENIPILSKSEWDWVVSDSFREDHSLFPFTRPENFALKSLNNFKLGRFQDSVIFIQLSVESLFKLYYLFYARVNNIDENKSDKIISNYRNLIEHTAKKYLEGDWMLVKSNELLFSYWNTTYNLRNKIIHSAYEPIYSETVNAIKAGLDLKRLISKSLKKFGGIDKLVNGYYSENYCYASELFYNDSSFSNEKQAQEFIDSKFNNETRDNTTT